MVGARVVLAIILGALLAACTASARPPTQSTAPATTAPTRTITPATASPMEAPSPVDPSPSPTAQPTPQPTPVPAPPKPTGVTFDEMANELADGTGSTITYTVAWGAPRADGVEIRVYGVTECPAAPTPLPAVADSGPCLVEHTPLPASVRVLLATAPASEGAVSWSWTGDPGCDVGWIGSGPGDSQFQAVVLAAYGPSDHSIFAIAQPGEWASFDPDDIVC